MKKKLVCFVMIAFVIVNILILVKYLYKMKIKKQIIKNPTVAFQYNDVAPSFKLFDTNGNVINSDSLKGKLILINIINPDDQHHWEIISYVNLISQIYKKKNFVAITVINGNPRNNKSILKNIRMPIVVDNKGSVLNLFQLEGCCGGTIIISNDGYIKFLTPYLLDSRTINQLVQEQLQRKTNNDSK